jgi:hypothetical protein
MKGYEENFVFCGECGRKMFEEAMNDKEPQWDEPK